MIPSNIIHRVLHLSSGDQTATGFLAHVDGREYLVTAQHFAKLIPTTGLEIFQGGAWHSVSVHQIGNSVQSDVSVLCLDFSICHQALTVELTTAGLTYGQDVHFLGYPFGFNVELEGFRNGYPMPFVKRATVSNLARFEGGDFWLDGINNVGFSGGPVVWGRITDLNAYRVCGFVSGYYEEDTNVVLAGQPTEYRTLQNSGLIQVASINEVLKLIMENPCGPAAKSD